MPNHHADPGDASYAALTLLDELMSALRDKGVLTDPERVQIIKGAMMKLRSVPQGDGAARVLQALYIESQP